jgi:DNA-directed RNA polymerase specialized sigma24 family protein
MDLSYVVVGVCGPVDQDANVISEESDPFVALYRTEYPGLVRLAHALTRSNEDAEDAVQEAFARLQGRMAGIDNPGGYLRTTVVHLCHDRDRRIRRDRRIHRAMPVPKGLSLGASELLDIVSALPYRQRATLVLRYWADWTETEIAEALGCRPGTVRTLASRGLERLKREMPDERR